MFHNIYVFLWTWVKYRTQAYPGVKEKMAKKSFLASSVETGTSTQDGEAVGQVVSRVWCGVFPWTECCHTSCPLHLTLACCDSVAFLVPREWNLASGAIFSREGWDFTLVVLGRFLVFIILRFKSTVWPGGIQSTNIDTGRIQQKVKIVK